MLRSVELKKFTVFEDARVDFSPGINVFLGANATGKTHAMKLVLRLAQSVEETLKASSLECNGDPAHSSAR